MENLKAYSTSKTSIRVSEINVNAPTKELQKERSNPLMARKSYRSKKKSDACSVETISVQNFEIPDEHKPILNIKCPILCNDGKTCRSPKIFRKPALHMSSSSVSRLDKWVLSVPREFKSKCSVTSSSISSSTSRSISNAIPEMELGEESIDIIHNDSKNRHNFKVEEGHTPCKESFIGGAPRPYIGTCPKNWTRFAKLSKSRQKFFLTQDPRKTHCLRNPQFSSPQSYAPQKEFNTLTGMVEQAENVCVGTASHSSESFICDVIDSENPFQLDFQGMDYKNTYQGDEQDIQNQRMFRNIVRYMDRRRVKAETEKMVEDQIQRERLAIPPNFAIVDRNEFIPGTPSVESVHFGKLYRASDKPYNQKIITDEHNRRAERYKNLYLRKKQRKEKLANEARIAEKAKEEHLASDLMLNNFNKLVDAINDAIRRTFQQECKLKRKEVHRRVFPHTLREALNFKHELKAIRRAERDEAKIRMEFFKEHLGKYKHYPEAEMEISSDTPKDSSEDPMSEQSSDDEDALKVGKEGELFKLRGFHFSLGDGIRGKRHQSELTGIKGQRRRKGCITREQWLSELVPKKEKIKVDVEVGIEKIKNPDDPDMDLFSPEFGFKATKEKSSPIKEYRLKHFGRHYHRMMRKKLKLVKPRLRYSVKKFNLIRFLYPDDNKMDTTQNIDEDLQDVKTQKTTQNYIDAKMRIKKKNHEKLKIKRLELLGLPCKVVKKSRLQTLCEHSDSDTDTDWVPKWEEYMTNDSDEVRSLAKNTRTPMRHRGNMPAPRYRESTLRCHPRHPRDYFGQRVPSQLFDQIVQTTNTPIMHKLREDSKMYANLHVKKRHYTDMFEARHHHDHYDPTQKRVVDVHYQAQVVTAGITKVNVTDAKVAEQFQMANPPCNAFIDMDITMPHYDVEAMIVEHSEQLQNTNKKSAKNRPKDLCRSTDIVFHSRNEAEKLDDFPGRQEYLQFLYEIRQQLQEMQDTDPEESLLHVDKDHIIEELEEDLKSIESCLTSLSSSDCTNLSNDSGSFLLMQGKTKVPLDYIRKSVVPFEELQRSRFKFLPIDVDAEDANPFKMMPFSGQGKDQLQLSGPKDSFFTFNTRLQNGVRLRLEIPVVDVRNKLLGTGMNKYPGAVTTDIDENYVDELKNRPSVKMFKFKSCGSMIKDAIRLKFESMLIQGQIVRTKIYDRLNEQHWELMQRTKLLYDKLFAKWEKNEYETSMSVVYKVKTYYDITDIMKREFRELERQLLLLNMDIVYIEGDWIRRIMLQNFHYLLADADWRYENDWIHRTDPTNDESELENFEESILKRTTVNIRQREKDDAWAIRTFYEQHYLQNKHPILIVFPYAENFLKGIDNLKNKTFVLLLELHFTLSIHTSLQERLETFEEWCTLDLAEKKEYVARKSTKKFFLMDRASELMETTLDFMQAPIDKSFNDEHFTRDRAVVAEVWRQIVPANIRGSSDKDFEPIDMVAMMADVVLELLVKFESISVKESNKIETALGKRRAYLQKMSYQAYQVEKRIDIEMKKVRKNLEPPYQKPKRVGKLPRMFIKKHKPPEVVQEKHISEHTKFVFRAFYEEGDVMQVEDARESIFVVDTIQEQIVPFYFDHFLKINGYQPTYNFKTQIEIRDGPEAERARVRCLVPDVIQRLERWENLSRKVMEDNISRNPQMYVNVNF